MCKSSIFIRVWNPLFTLIMSLLKCTGCNNIHAFCTEYVEKFFVTIGFLCKGRIYLYSKVDTATERTSMHIGVLQCWREI